jgi:hypothetical protein
VKRCLASVEKREWPISSRWRGRLRPARIERACRSAIPVVVCLVVLIGGCGRGNRTVPAGGVVTLDGQPLAGAAVLLVPMAGGMPSRGSTQSDGSFALTTFAQGDGAMVGRHRVTVSKIELNGVNATADGLQGMTNSRQIQVKHLSPERYETAATSGLEVTVERSGKNRFELQLSSK